MKRRVNQPNRIFRLEYLNGRYKPARWSWLGTFATPEAARAAVQWFDYLVGDQDTRVVNRITMQVVPGDQP